MQITINLVYYSKIKKKNSKKDWMVTVKIDFAKPRGIGNYKNTVA